MAYFRAIRPRLRSVSDSPTTVLLQAARDGDRAALDALLPRVYGELRQIAHARLRRGRPGQTLNTTALVHEAYLKLTAGETPGWESRVHFFALAARAMRFILVDYAREKTAEKRGGGALDLPLNAALDVASLEEDAHNLLTLDGALTRLGRHNDRLAQTVEMRFYGGMEYAEIAEATGRSVSTIKREWRRARVWLHAALASAQDDPPGGEVPNEPVEPPP